MIATQTPSERKQKRTTRKLLKAGYGFEVREISLAVANIISSDFFLVGKLNRYVWLLLMESVGLLSLSIHQCIVTTGFEMKAERV